MAVGDKLMGAESHWLMGRVMPRDFLKRVGEYLDDAAPKRKKEILDSIRARAEELADADKDMPVDSPSKGVLAISAVVLASYEERGLLATSRTRRLACGQGRRGSRARG